jgi:NAD(P)-dependent dehydrogenase (short-subunit alcohol dehydrogenase family)
MDILVIGVDSDIGAAIAAHHTAQGAVVHTTSRNGKGTYDLELAHPRRWPKLGQKYDCIYPNHMHFRMEDTEQPRLGSTNN